MAVRMHAEKKHAHRKQGVRKRRKHGNQRMLDQIKTCLARPAASPSRDRPCHRKARTSDDTEP
jgi:hypothetical protein